MNRLSNYEPIQELYISAFVNDVPVGTWRNETFVKTCVGGSFWIVKKLDEESSLNWMISNLESQSANVTFR